MQIVLVHREKKVNRINKPKRSEKKPCLPVLSEEVNDVQRRSIHQPDGEMKSRLALFLK